jgi:hypothetical protein
MATFPAADSLQTKTVDTLGRNKLRDSLLLLQEQRKSLCRYPLRGNDLVSLPTSRLFSSDMTGPSELLATSPFSVPVRFGLSSQLNRFLPYGNVAPVERIFSEGSLLSNSPGQLTGSDDVSVAELSSVTAGPDNVCRYSLYPVHVAVPEGSFFWENGVFDENILNARFLRPLSDRMTVNLFSSYRYFKAQRYAHDGNNVSTFFKALYTDTNLVSDNGYNPLTNEFTAGTRLRWSGMGGNEVLFGAKYADWATEMALDRPAALAADLYWARINQYRSTFDLGFMKNHFGKTTVDISGCYESNSLVRFAPDSTGTTVRRDGADRTLSLAARAAVSPRGMDTIALLYGVRQNNRLPFAMGESRSFNHTPEVSYSLPYSAGPLLGVCTLDAGCIVFKRNASLGYSPTWSLSTGNDIFGQHLRVFTTQSAIPYAVPFDTVFFLSAAVLDLYRVNGADITLAKQNTGCIVGFQSIEGVNDLSVRNSWPEGEAPYKQPHLAILAAPYFGPWHGLTVTSRGLFTDSKPFVKAQASVSYTGNPRNTGEYIDLRLRFDYWSRRDTLLFAGIGDWNRELYDLGLEIAVQVKTFRFFSKIDNILNRSIAYVPGYLLPGINFRWGITWFLQR